MSSFNINAVHDEIKRKHHTYKQQNMKNPQFLILSIDLWFDIKHYSKDAVPPEHQIKSDGCWYLYGMKVSMLDGSCAQKRILEVG